MIIDRFEADLAVCELPDKSHLHIPRHLLPPAAREGDCLLFSGGKYSIDAAATNLRRKTAFDLFKRLSGR